jgi:hypothetical protein
VSDRRTPEQVAFDELVLEQLDAIQRGGAFDFLLELDDGEWLDFMLGWIRRQGKLAPLTETHRATVIALMRFSGPGRGES